MLVAGLLYIGLLQDTRSLAAALRIVAYMDIAFTETWPTS